MEKNKKRIITSLRLPFQFVALIWVIHFFQALTNLDFGIYGIKPRELFGLRGIVFSPLIHADLRHLISNSAPIFFLSVMILYFYRRVALRSMMMIYLLTGLAVWVVGRDVFHIGASGVVYGLVSYVFWSGVFRRSLQSIILALIVVFLYSSLFLGILPNQPGISWESHLLGAFARIFAAYWYKEEIEADEQKEPPTWEEEQAPPDFFLERDVFDKTKAERERSDEP